jgi:hypothetical protein
MRTVQIVESNYCPWDEMVGQDNETGGYGWGSELVGLKPDELLRVVDENLPWQTVAATLFGWWAEHHIAKALIDIYEVTQDEMRVERASAQEDYRRWVDAVDMGDLNEALRYLLWDDIRSLLPVTHEWDVIDGYYSVYPLWMEEERI